MVTFGISLRARTANSDWRETCELLSATLGSVLRQSDSRFRVIICGRDWPDIQEMADERIEFLRALVAPPRQTSRFERDKSIKRMIMGLRLRALGGGLFMQLDSDDFVHRDLVAFTLADRAGDGVVVTHGYVLDRQRNLIAPVPGVWPVEIDRVCGSTAIIRYEVDDIPSKAVFYSARPFLFMMNRNHTAIRSDAAEIGRTSVVPFPGVVYVLNTAQNLSFQAMHRSGIWRETVLKEIRRLAITDRTRLQGIDSEFGTALAAGPDLAR